MNTAVSSTALPVVVIGAGPVGLAAAVHLVERGLEPLVLEADTRAGAAIERWGHVRMFSPWEYNVDPRAAALLERHGWRMPEPSRHPTGAELVERYLAPLSATAELAPHIRTGARVVAVTRHRRDLMKHAQRDAVPFAVRWIDAGGVEHEQLAQAVVDASGTYGMPSPAGASGVPALGERAAAGSIAYGVPDVAGTQRARYAGRRVLVVGSGHSAFNVLAELARLRGETGAGEVHWAVRRPTLARVLGGGENDRLAERGRLGLRIGALVARGSVALHAAFALDRIERTPEGLVAWSGERALPPVDEIVAATGFRPELSVLSEMRLDLDAATQSPSALAPLIDPNLHSCGTVRPHGAAELAQPERGLYLAGMKSYGRAPTFLLRTGYEQVRSIAAELAGDHEAARRVELVLPETGVCATDFPDDDLVSAAACCSTTAPAPQFTASG